MILKKGSSSNSKQAVRGLNLLLGLGNYQTFTANTKAAVKAFQKLKGLKVDGIAGPKTFEALVKTLPDVKYKDFSGSIYVKAVQALVSCSIDGQYGSKTRANVMALQKSAGLDATGNVGQNEWRAMFDLDLTKKMTVVPEISGIKTSNAVNIIQPVDYKQADSRWGKKA